MFCGAPEAGLELNPVGGEEPGGSSGLCVSQLGRSREMGTSRIGWRQLDGVRL